MTNSTVSRLSNWRSSSSRDWAVMRARSTSADSLASSTTFHSTSQRGGGGGTTLLTGASSCMLAPLAISALECWPPSVANQALRPGSQAGGRERLADRQRAKKTRRRLWAYGGSVITIGRFHLSNEQLPAMFAGDPPASTGLSPQSCSIVRGLLLRAGPVTIWFPPIPRERRARGILRKEVIQPQVPLRLPCYDLVPIAEFIFGACFLAVSTATSDAPHFRGLTGGVYKAQEHIHRGMLTRDY